MTIERWEIPPIPESIPDNIRERMERSYARMAAVDDEAWGLWEAHGWEQVNAYANALVKRDLFLNMLIGLGWLTGGISGATYALEYHAQEHARDGNHDTAVVMRLLSISAQSCGPPGDPSEFPAPVEAAAVMLLRVRLDLPDDADWAAANVDAALDGAVDAVTWQSEAEDQ